MIEEYAVVISLQVTNINPHNQSVATLEIERKTACGLCGKTRGCGNSIWGKLFSHQSSAFKALNHINAKVGDSVIVGINESALLKSAMLLYMLPLATLFIGAMLVMQISNTNASTMLGAAVGLMLGLIWVKGHSAANQYFVKQQPVILRLATNGLEVKLS